MREVWPSVRLASALGLLAGGAFPWPTWAQSEGCTDCHDETLAPFSIHADLVCSDCHADLSEAPHPDGGVVADDAACAQCHEAADELAEGPHAIDELGCGSCHGAAHQVVGVAEAASPMSALRQIATCGACHEDGEGLLDGYVVSIHGRALHRSGLVTAAPSCSDCHGGHRILPAEDPRSQISPRRIPETCGDCHSGILSVWRDASAHGIGWAAGDTPPVGDRRFPVCTTCHDSHRVIPPTQRAERLQSPETCGDCHSGRFSTFRDSFHGKATDLGFLTGAICSDCHTPHQNLPAEDPRSSIHASRLQETCGRCHGEVTAAFTSFEPHADPARAVGRPELHAVWLFMTGLLIAVFGLFGLHDLLWLQRSAVAWWRGELAPERSREGPYVRRFSPFQIRLHVTVILTFFVLAATGLPLKYHGSAWAQAAVSLFGGVATARALHRVAAILTFLYFLAHLASVAKRALWEREPGILWGWKSMVPRGKDLRDLWANLRYFLYRRARPRFDRWTYWEKFDYFAVFWGVAIIGGSGVMLWFPTLVTRVLPGWTLNAAMVIHSDEALLAVGFIFVFHFFHTHLRPESFPLDPVIFTGTMPLERFKAERPHEYQRLVESGELEARLAEAPSPQQLRRAFRWGATAVTVGILLIIAILVGVLQSSL